jgi:hypothetical protein
MLKNWKSLSFLALTMGGTLFHLGCGLLGGGGASSILIFDILREDLFG